MFYSHELLGRKSPLGAVWIAAHGKKLNRSKVMNVNVVQTCEQLINPDVPQALRLQGILIGGIVIVFSRQQTYLLGESCQLKRKVRAMTIDRQAGNTVLEKGKQQARPDAITAPDLDAFFGGRLNLALMNPFATSVHLDEAPLEDDLFVMPTIPDSFGDDRADFVGGERLQRNNRATRAALPLTMPDHNPIMALPTGLELQDTMLMDQEETFMMPELGMDMFDNHMPPVNDMPDVAPGLEVQPEADVMMEFPQDVMEIPMPAEQPEEFVAELGVAEGQDRQQEAEPAVVGSLEAVAEEQSAAEGAARQARARGRGRKRPTQLVIDEADSVQIKGTVFRAWTQDTQELIQERPQKLMRLVVATHYPGCRPVPQATGADMLSAAPLSAGFSQGGKWGAELEEMFVNSMLPADAAGHTPEIQQPEAEDMQPLMNKDAMPPTDAIAADIDMPDHTANDICMLEEEVEVERLRAALATPGSMTEQDHAKAVQLGLTPGSSNPLERRGHKRQKRSSSAFRVESDARPTEDRSSPHSQRRLSDLMMGVDVGDVNVGLEGQLDDMLPPEPVDMDVLPPGEASGPGGGTAGLTQFQLMEDSAPATQTQKAVTDAVNKSTLSMIGLLRDRFTDLEEHGAEQPTLSLFQMTASLTRSQAAKLFYQICG
ncbi:hypothetical protein WJX77_008069 [Trebouxia sp. C0004]